MGDRNGRRRAQPALADRIAARQGPQGPDRDFDSGEQFALDAEYLRVMSPSAEVQGHSPDERKTVPGKRQVAILEVHPIGNYAVRLVFDDLHSTGIYSWDYLLELGHERAHKWQDYLDELARARALSRRAGRRGIDRDYCTITVVPTATRSYRSLMSSLVRRKQPDDTAWPMVSGSFEPWMR